MIRDAAIRGLLTSAVFLAGLALLGRLDGWADIVFGLAFGLVATISYNRHRRRRAARMR